MESAVTLLPEPLSPTKQSVSPGFMENDTPSTARTACEPEPKSSWRFLISNNGHEVTIRAAAVASTISVIFSLFPPKIHVFYLT
jgi:hypothetical protein